MATMIWTICSFYEITEGKVELACDGLQALRHASQVDWLTDSKQPQFDLLSATRAMFRHCPVVLQFRHVKGHQDNWDGVLDEWASLNVAMDDGAKEHWHRTQECRNHSPYIFGEPWPFWIAGTKITKDVATNISEHIDGVNLCEYWEKKGRFGQAQVRMYIGRRLAKQ